MIALKKKQKTPIKKSKLNAVNGASEVIFGSFAIKSLENGNITSKQLEAARKILSRTLKKVSKIWIKIKPNKSISSKIGDKRMGKGKGEPSYQIFNVLAGTTLFEVEGFNSKTIVAVLNVAKKKLPIRSKLVYKKSL